MKGAAILMLLAGCASAPTEPSIPLTTDQAKICTEQTCVLITQRDLGNLVGKAIAAGRLTCAKGDTL